MVSSRRTTAAAVHRKPSKRIATTLRPSRSTRFPARRRVELSISTDVSARAPGNADNNYCVESPLDGTEVQNTCFRYQCNNGTEEVLGPSAWSKQKPNESCGCGSGSKYKKCCGRPGSIHPSIHKRKRIRPKA